MSVHMLEMDMALATVALGTVDMDMATVFQHQTNQELQVVMATADLNGIHRTHLQHRTNPAQAHMALRQTNLDLA